MIGRIFSDAEVKNWRPALIELTQIGNPEVDGGLPTTCFIDPALIMLVHRAMTRWRTMTGVKPDDYQWQDKGIESTNIWLHGGATLSVLETPQEVNEKRNQAYGQEPPKTAKIPVLSSVCKTCGKTLAPGTTVSCERSPCGAITRS